MPRRRDRGYGGLVPGLIMMAVGTVFLLERADLISMRYVWRLWPLAVIVVGLMQLLAPGRGRRSIFVLLVGIWLQISTLELFGLGFDDSWPLLIIFVGASFVFDALVSKTGSSPAVGAAAARSTITGQAHGAGGDVR